MKIKKIYIIPYLGLLIALYHLILNLFKLSVVNIWISFAGLMLNFVISFWLFAFMVSPAILTEQHVARTKFNINKVDSAIKVYWIKNGCLPDSLSDKSLNLMEFYSDDPFINRVLHKKHKLYYRKLDDYSFEIRSVGKDSRLFTKDDICSGFHYKKN